MKIKSFFFLLVLAIAMTSCFDGTGTHTTPQMMFGNLYVNPQFVGDSLIGVKDTLGTRYDTEIGMEYLDTIQLGDTIMFPALFTSEMNNLVSIIATYDTTRVNLWFDIDSENQAVVKALATGSKPEKGLLLFNPMYNLFAFPIYMVPQAAGAHPIKITVTSDSKFSPNSAVFTMLVK